MENPQQWNEFTQQATQIIKQGQKTNKYKTRIGLILEPHFHNVVYFQLVWEDETINWYRTTWWKHLDVPKFNDVMDRLKYIGKVIEPTITYENGKIDLEKGKDILTFVKTLSIKPRIDKGGIVLDGYHFTLIIGVENMETIYKWQYLPEEWTDLEALADM